MSRELAEGLAERAVGVGSTGLSSVNFSGCDAAGMIVGTIGGVVTTAADALGSLRTGKAPMPGRSFVAGATIGEITKQLCIDLTEDTQLQEEDAYEKARQAAANATNAGDDPEETTGPSEKPADPVGEDEGSDGGDINGSDSSPHCSDGTDGRGYG